MVPEELGEWLAIALTNRPQTEDGKIEDVEITHRILPAGEKTTLISGRNALLQGLQSTVLTLDTDLIIRELSYEGGVWMTDSPQEVLQMYEPLQMVEGDVLVGGLGLGVFSRLASLQEKVHSVYTVESDPKIEKLVAPTTIVYFRGMVILQNLFEHCREVEKGDYDSAFLDIWQGTGEYIWMYYVVPLRRLLRNKIPQQKIFCWNEDEMKGQLMGGPFPGTLYNSTLYDISSLKNYVTVFQEAAKKHGMHHPILNPSRDLDYLEQAQRTRKNPRLQALVNKYLLPGTDEWEQEFGELWDAMEADRNKRKHEYEESLRTEKSDPGAGEH